MTDMNYGVIGNGRSAALVHETGSIDWCCLPTFDSSSVFGAILDQDRGGTFGISIKDQVRHQQEYVPRTNILSTKLFGPTGEVEILDFMPRFKSAEHEYHCPPDVIRYIRPIKGRPQIHVDYRPALNYAEFPSISENQREYIKTTTSSGPYESVYLYSNLDLDSILKGTAIELDQEGFLWLSYNEKLRAPDIRRVELEFERTKVYWLAWVAESRSFPEYSEAIERSSLVLKLLAYQKTGAVLAAVTTSLPEEIGGQRNWDYRYCWLRDASMIVRVFTEIGHYRVGRRFQQFILDAIPYKREKIQLMYGIDGQRELPERTLPWLSGFEGSSPVRVGNAAYTQTQNDIFGLVMETLYQRFTAFPNEREYHESLWTVIRALVRHIERHWDEPDAGIWEFRGHRKHFTFSKLLCWVGVDRAIQIAKMFGRDRYVASWSPLRDRIRRDILTRGWNEKLQSFTQSYGDAHLDAANLLVEQYGLVDAQDPRYVNTVNLTYERLCKDGIMFRYRNDDDFGTPSSAFTVCTFWMIRALHRIGRTERAREMFETMLGSSNHLGLFSEDMEISTKRLLGNFPQGYSHLALIDAAITLTDRSAISSHAEIA